MNFSYKFELKLCLIKLKIFLKTTNIERDESGRFPEGVNFEGISPGKTHTFRLIAVSEEGESNPVLYRVTTEEVEFKVHLVFLNLKFI